MYKLRELLLISILLISCESNNDPEYKEKIEFNTITTTDDFGNILTSDSTDCKLNDYYNILGADCELNGHGDIKIK